VVKKTCQRSLRMTPFPNGPPKIQGIPAIRDFTIRDPLYFVIQFQASIL
jgi:hypothetical protein